MSDLGFIGLGRMGRPVLQRILSKFSVKAAYNRNAVKAAGLQGVVAVDEPFKVGSSCDIILVMVSDDEACESVIFGEKGLIRTIRPQSIVVNLSTVSPEFTRSASTRLSQSMCAYLDAPVLGNASLAEKGELISLISGPQEQIKAVEKVLESFSRRVFYLGTVGTATKMKLIADSVMAVNLAAVGEALLMGEKSGISKETALEILDKSEAGSVVLTSKKESLIKEDFIPGLMLKQMVTELSYASELSISLSSPLALGATAQQFYIAAASIGLGNLDFSSVIRAFRFMAGRS